MALWLPNTTDLPSLKVWLDAEAESVGSLTTWTDQSGNGNSPTQATSTKRPVVTANKLNGKKAVVFTRANGSSLTKTSLTGITDNTFTVFAIWEHGYSTSQDEMLLSVYDGTYPDTIIALIGNSAASGPTRRSVTWIGNTGNKASYQPPNGSYHLATVTHSPALREYCENGVSKGTNTTSQATDTVSILDIGSRLQATGDYLDGSIAELVYISGTLSTFDKQRIEGYLAWKWGITAWLDVTHPYKTAPPMADYATATDAAPILDRSVVLADSVTATEVINPGLGTLFTQSLNDSVTLSDDVAKGIAPALADSASSADAAPPDTVAQALADSITPTEAWVRDVSHPLADSATPSDSVLTEGDILPPAGYIFLQDQDGAYLLDQDGYYLIEANAQAPLPLLATLNDSVTAIDTAVLDGGLSPPLGYVFLVDPDGYYLLDQDGYYLVEPDGGALTTNITKTLTDSIGVTDDGGVLDVAPAPPDGFYFLVDQDGAYLLDQDGAYLVEPATGLSGSPAATALDDTFGVSDTVGISVAPQAPAGFVFLVDQDGTYLLDQDGYYLVEPDQTAGPVVPPDITPPAGYVFLIDQDGTYLLDQDGYYLVEPLGDVTDTTSVLSIDDAVSTSDALNFEFPLEPPAGYYFLVDQDGTYLLDQDGSYLIELANGTQVPGTLTLGDSIAVSDIQDTAASTTNAITSAVSDNVIASDAIATVGVLTASPAADTVGLSDNVATTLSVGAVTSSIDLADNVIAGDALATAGVLTPKVIADTVGLSDGAATNYTAAPAALSTTLADSVAATDVSDVSGLLPSAPTGYVFLIDQDGYYLLDRDGSYLVEPTWEQAGATAQLLDSVGTSEVTTFDLLRLLDEQVTLGDSTLRGWSSTNLRAHAVEDKRPITSPVSRTFTHIVAEHTFGRALDQTLADSVQLGEDFKAVRTAAAIAETQPVTDSVANALSRRVDDTFGVSDTVNDLNLYPPKPNDPVIATEVLAKATSRPLADSVATPTDDLAFTMNKALDETITPADVASAGNAEFVLARSYQFSTSTQDFSLVGASAGQLAVIRVVTTSATPTIPAGWSGSAVYTGVSLGYKHRVFWKVLDSTDISTGFVTLVTDSAGFGSIVFYTGATGVTVQGTAEASGGFTTLAGFIKAGNCRGVIASLMDRQQGIYAAPTNVPTRRFATTGTFFSHTYADNLSPATYADSSAVVFASGTNNGWAVGYLLELTA